MCSQELAKTKCLPRSLSLGKTPRDDIATLKPEGCFCGAICQEEERFPLELFQMGARHPTSRTLHDKCFTTSLIYNPNFQDESLFQYDYLIGALHFLTTCKTVEM